MAHFSRQTFSPLLLPLLLAACGRGEVDLGAGATPVVAPRGASCVDSTVIDGAVVAQSQDDLAALAGCEEIHGDLQIVPFIGADLTPLSALRSVEGQLLIGATVGDPVHTAIDGQPTDPVTALISPQQLEDRLGERDWLTSLAGLESLESVGSLGLGRTSVPDLQPLSHLRSLGNDRTGSVSGQLAISATHGLRDLHGLEHAAGLTSLYLNDNQDLVSLDGLSVPASMDSLWIQGYALTDIGALAPLTAARTELLIQGTSIQDLDALSQLSQAQRVDILYNNQLVDASGLSALQVITLDISYNPLLKTLPSFSNSEGSLNLQISSLTLKISSNDALPSVNLDFTKYLASDGSGGRAGTIYIIGNRALTSIRSVGFSSADTLLVEANPSLTELDLSGFKSFQELDITQNASLTKVDIPALQTVDTLDVDGNPLLPTANFAAVRTFTSTMNGNADAAPAQ